MTSNASRLIKDALDHLLTIQEIAARPLLLDQVVDLPTIQACTHKAVMRLLTADALLTQRTEKETTMPLPTPAELGGELLALDNEHGHIPLKLSPIEAWVIMAQIQLALRCPGNQGPTAIIAKTVAIYLQDKIATTPALAAVAEAGWSQDYGEEAGP